MVVDVVIEMAVGGGLILLSFYEPILCNDVLLFSVVLFTVVGSVGGTGLFMICVYGFACGLVTLMEVFA